MRTARTDSRPALMQGGRDAVRNLGRCLLSWLAAALCLWGLSGIARGEEPEAVGRFVSVPATLDGDMVNRIRQITEYEFDRFKTAEQERDRQRPDIKQRREFRVVYDFNPDRQANSITNFSLCLELARSIEKLKQKGVQTIAFVHGPVTGHTVLPVLACQQRVFSDKATLGPVLVRGVTSLEEYEKKAYNTLTANESTQALIAKLYDRDSAVVRGKKGGFVRTTDPDAGPHEKPIFEAGLLATFDFAKAKATGLCELDAMSDREVVRRAYRLSREALQENPLLGSVVAWQIPVNGEVNRGLKEQLDRRIRRALRASPAANLIVLELRCSGGDTGVASEIANETLRRLNEGREDNPVVTIAYITEDAQDTAVYLAFGCDYIVMNRKATLGGFARLLRNRSEAERTAIAEGLADLARKQSYPPALARAMVDNSVRELFHVTSARGTREWDILTGRQLDEERAQRPGHWNEERIPLDGDGYLTLDADQAARFGVAHGRVDDLNGLYVQFGVKPSKVHVSGPDWLDDLADFLRNDWTSFLLVMIGITCLFLELKLPGIGLPGVVAAICFVLFFWAHSKLGGEVTWLAILLFLLGLVLIGLEIFVLPGFGVCGISGIVLMIGSLALVTYGHWPRDGGEWVLLTRRIGPFGLCLMAAVMLAILLARYLPNIPFANRLLLRPQTEGDGIEEAPDPTHAANAALLGAIGVASTPLRPAGKVQFGEQFVDVVAEGSFVGPGTRVQVIEVEGNRIVVKQV